MRNKAHKQEEGLLLSIPLLVLLGMTVWVCAFLFNYNFSRQDIEGIAQDAHVVAYVHEENVIIYIMETQDPRIRGLFTDMQIPVGLQFVVFSRSHIFSRYTISLNFLFDENRTLPSWPYHLRDARPPAPPLPPEWWRRDDLAYDGGMHTYKMSIEGASIAEGLEITLTRQGIRGFNLRYFLFWVVKPILLITPLIIWFFKKILFKRK